MATSKKQETGQSQTKYMWFGFGNYGGQPIQQIGGGIVRDPNMLNKMHGNSAEHSPLLYLAGTVIGLTLLAILFVWGLTLIL